MFSFESEDDLAHSMSDQQVRTIKNFMVKCLQTDKK
jgi:hypothetical protein